MNARSSDTSPLLLRGAGLLLLGGAAWAQHAPPRPTEAVEPLPATLGAMPDLDVRALAADALDGLRFDAPGDGSLWARGESYKARFDGRGATVVPFFGSDAPRNYPLGLEVAAASQGGAPLAAAAHGTVSRDGDVVRIDRGAFVEEYLLSESALEQRFVFPTLPAKGDLRLRLAVSTELAAQQDGASLRFANELGHVDYGRAFVLDAAGRRSEMERVLVDGEIELRVPAAFADAAAFPLVIDPLITFFTIGGSGLHEITPDVSYDVTADRWCVAWTTVWSATDYDMYARQITGAGTLLDTLPIDFTTDSWVTPGVADNNGADLFLVTAAVVPASGVADIRGRFIPAGTDVVGDVIPLTPADGAYRNFPDVGGDPFSGGSRFCVVWQRYVHDNAVDIEYRTVAPTGALGPIQTLNTSEAVHLFPSISSSMGRSDGQEVWTVVWQTRHNLTDNDVYGAQLNWDGSLRHPMYPITTTTWNETRPVVSTVLEASTPGDARPYMVVFERDFGSDHDLVGAVLQGPNLLATENLVGEFDEEYWFRDQVAPSIDSDGAQFFLAFEERATPSDPDPDIYACSYFWLDGALESCLVRAPFVGSPAAEVEVSVYSMASSGGPGKRFFGTWTYASANEGLDVQGGLYDACGGFAPTSYCFGDGSGQPCPCDNPGAAGHGCRNSAHTAGALLDAAGDASVGADTFALHVEGSVPSKPGLFFQGDNVVGDGAGVAFGDGLRCAGGNVVRLEVRVADPTGAAMTSVGIAASGGAEAGVLRRYQWWYRDPAGSPCGTTFNLSNGLEVRWMP